MSPDQYIASGILELYAAGVLPPEEMEAVAAMAAEHPRIQEELKAILEAYRQYALFHNHRPLPATAVESIIEKIKQSPPPPPPATKSKTEPKVPKAAPAPAAAKSTPPPAVREPARNLERPPVRPRPEEQVTQQRRSNAGLIFMLIFCLLLLIAGAVYVFYLANEWQKTRNELGTLQAEHNRINQAYNDLRAAQTPAPVPVNGDLQVLQDMNYKILRLKGQKPAPEAEAVLFWNKADGKLFLRIYNIPAPPAGKQYQLWAIQPDNKSVDAGVITNLAPDKALIPMKSVTDAKAFAVTLEREGGNAEPTSAIYLVVNI